MSDKPQTSDSKSDHWIPGEPRPNTEFKYFWRNPENWKYYHSVVFPGTLSDAEIEAMLDSLPPEGFKPGLVGIPSVSEDEDDEWHEPLFLLTTSKNPDEGVVDIGEFLRKMVETNWNDDPDANWKNNAIQFPRLISEAQAAGAFTDDVVAGMCESMDLGSDDIFDIIQRADSEWERIKRKTRSPNHDS